MITETIAAITAITAGSIAIAEKIHEWHSSYRKATESNSDEKIEKAVLIDSKGQRLLLENATIEELKEFLGEDNEKDQEEK